MNTTSDCSSLLCQTQAFSLGAGGAAIPGFYHPYVAKRVLTGAAEKGEGHDYSEDDRTAAGGIYAGLKGMSAEALDRAGLTGLQSTYDEGFIDIDNVHPRIPFHREHTHRKFGVTQEKLMATIPAIIIGALIFVAIIAFFELLRTFYEETFVFNKELELGNRYKLTLDRLPIFIFTVAIVVIFITFIIKLFD